MIAYSVIRFFFFLHSVTKEWVFAPNDFFELVSRAIRPLTSFAYHSQRELLFQDSVEEKLEQLGDHQYVWSLLCRKALTILDDKGLCHRKPNHLCNQFVSINV